MVDYDLRSLRSFATVTSTITSREPLTRRRSSGIEARLSSALMLIRRSLGLEPPVSGGDHQYMKGRGIKLRTPSSHRGHRLRLAGAHPSAGRDRARGMGSALILFLASP